MERSFESIVDELKARVNSISSNVDYILGFELNDGILMKLDSIGGLLDDFNQNLDDLKEKRDKLKSVYQHQKDLNKKLLMDIEKMREEINYLK